MVKRNKRETPSDLPDGGVSNKLEVGRLELLRDCLSANPIIKSLEKEIPRGLRSKRRVRRENLEVQDAEDGSFELLKDFLYARHFNSPEKDKIKNCCNLGSSSSQEIPLGLRSNTRVTMENLTVQDAEMLHTIRESPSYLPACFSGSNEAGSLEESRSHCQLANHPLKPRNLRRKRKVESSISVIISKPSLRSCRQSRRLHGSTTVIPKWEKLDSQKFECYLEIMWRRFTSEEKSGCTYLDCLWFSLYTKETHKEKVLSWIKRKDIFSKKYVFVPIVQWGHWFLVVFCHFDESDTKNRCMLLLDSMQKANSEQLEPRIRRFVFDIFKKEERPEEELINKIPLLIPKVPQQKSGEECGFFVLYYINQFMESAVDNISFSSGYPNLMKEDWFTPEDVECFVKNLDSMDKKANMSD